MTIDLFPDGYLRGPRLTAWEALLDAKGGWLILKIAAHEELIGILRRQLTPDLDAEQRKIINERIRFHKDAIRDAKAEEDILTNGTLAQKKALVKRNVRLWIRNLRSRAADFRRYADEEKRLASEANNQQDRKRHEANEEADRRAANEYEKMAGEFDSDLDEAGL